MASTNDNSKTPGRRSVQPPLMAEVPDAVTETVIEKPVGFEAIQVFAHAVGDVEALAMMGNDELILQLARIAYTRARVVARELGKEA